MHVVQIVINASHVKVHIIPDYALAAMTPVHNQVDGVTNVILFVEI